MPAACQALCWGYKDRTLCLLFNNSSKTVNKKKFWEAPKGIPKNKYRFYTEVTQFIDDTLTWGKCGFF